jgi:CheY-like chemotaxis protein
MHSSSPPPHCPKHDCKVLIVDDNPEVADSTALLLNYYGGFQVVAV